MNKSTRQWKMIHRAVTALALLATVSFGLGAERVPVVTKKVEPPHVAPHHVLPHINPHLHIPAKARKEVPVALARRHWRSHWHHIWAFSEWATWHRGLGIIEGNVHSGSGEPLAGIQVSLRTSTGQTFQNVARRHVTFTSGGGTFIMVHVRSGNYRVRAEHGKANGHVSIHVGAGRMTSASIKL